MEPLTPSVLAWLTAAIAAPTVALVYVYNGLDRKWSAVVGFVGVAALLALFAYTANVIMALYGAMQFPPDMQLVELGVAYQRVAAGQLAAVSLIVGLLAVGYYMEISRRGHE